MDLISESTKNLTKFLYLFIYQLGLSLNTEHLDRSKKENKCVWNGALERKEMKCW